MSESNTENKTNQGKFDLSGVFDVQQDYITDLSGSYPNVNNAPLVAKQVLKLQDKIQDVTKSYKDANTSANNVLTEQNNMMDIVSDEQKRLNEKKFLIDQAEMEQRRKVTLTNSNRLRNAEYTKIILVFVFMVIVHIVLLLISKHAFDGEVPEGVSSFLVLLHIINLSICLSIATYIYFNIQSRSQIHFDQLELPPPDLSGAATSAPAISNYNNLFKDLNVCTDANCCGTDTKWNSTSKACESSSSSDSNDNVIEGYSSLLANPSFISSSTTVDTKDTKEDSVVPFDATTATDEEIRAKVDKDVAESMSKFTDMTANVGDDAESSANEAIAAGAEISKNMGSSMGSSISNSLEKLNSNVKCNFSTMEDAHPNMNKVTRSNYKPEDSNVLLPLKPTIKDTETSLLLNRDLDTSNIQGGTLDSNTFSTYP